MKRSDHHLIQQVLDGTISPAAFAGFQQRMRVEPELARLYGEYAMLNHSLCEEFEGQKWQGESYVKSKLLSSSWLIGLAAAAIVVLAVVGIRKSPWKANAGNPLAKASFSTDAVWQIDGAFKSSGNGVGIVPGGKLHLQQGLASIAIGSATTALIEGPATLAFTSKNSLDLAEGRARFHVGNSKGGFKVVTPSLTASVKGTDFAIESYPGRPGELHVIEGTVGMLPTGRKDETFLATGEAARVSDAGVVERIPADEKRFPKELGRFESVLSGPFVKADWRMEYGSAMISENGMDGANYSAFYRMPAPEPGEGNSVLLATLEVGRPSLGEFHTDGWAGMSFFSKGAEVLFFGDAFGPERTWSLDVKQRIPVIIPATPVLGPRTVTLCYRKKTGEVSLHEGGIPLGKPFCNGKLPSGLEFDEIRLGASSGAALNVQSLTVRVGGGG